MNKKTIKRTVEIAFAMCPTNRKKEGTRAAHVAVLVKKNRIIKIGWNKHRTHPRTKRFPYVGSNIKYNNVNVCIHAELDVLMKSGKSDLSDHEIIVLRVDGENKLNNSKPCYGCMTALKQHKLKNIYFSNSDGKIEQKAGQ